MGNLSVVVREASMVVQMVLVMASLMVAYLVVKMG
jgi:hypothetical protein